MDPAWVPLKSRAAMGFRRRQLSYKYASRRSATFTSLPRGTDTRTLRKGTKLQTVKRPEGRAPVQTLLWR